MSIRSQYQSMRYVFIGLIPVWDGCRYRVCRVFATNLCEFIGFDVDGNGYWLARDIQANRTVMLCSAPSVSQLAEMGVDL